MLIREKDLELYHNNDYLMHYGKLGMKWGKRQQKAWNSKLTAANKKRGIPKRVVGVLNPLGGSVMFNKTYTAGRLNGQSRAMAGASSIGATAVGGALGGLAGRTIGSLSGNSLISKGMGAAGSVLGAYGAHKMLRNEYGKQYAKTHNKRKKS